MSTLPQYNPTDVYEVPAEGISHRCRFVEYGDLKDSTRGDGQYIYLTFQVEDPTSDDHGIKFGDNFGWKMTPKTKLYKVAKALLGDDIDETSRVTLEGLKDRICYLTVEHVVKPNPDDPKNPLVYAKVIGAAPIVRKRRDEPQQQPIPQAEYDHVGTSGQFQQTVTTVPDEETHPVEQSWASGQDEEDF